MTTALPIILATLLGACVGSFLNVVVHRLPRGESVVRPRSRCPGCERRLAAWENVPVVSWLALRGRCRGCGAPIAIRYPLVEAGTALLYGGVVAAKGLEAETILALAFVTALIPAALIDLDHQIIPNRIMAVAAIVGILLAALLAPGTLPTRLLAALAAGGPLFALVMLHPRGMGMGDAKLAGVMGLYLGWAVAPAMLIGFALGAVIGVAIVMRHGLSARKHAVPFGPFLAAGAVAAIFVGEPLVDWYLTSFFDAGS